MFQISACMFSNYMKIENCINLNRKSQVREQFCDTCSGGQKPDVFSVFSGLRFAEPAAKVQE